MIFPFLEHCVMAHGIFTKSHPKIMAHEEEPLQRWKWFGMVGASKEKSKRYQPQLEVLHFGMAKKCEAKTFQLGSKCWKWENVIKTLLSKASPLWYFFIFGSDEIFECLQYGLPFKIDYHKKIQNGLPFQIIIRKVVYFEDINCLKWTTIPF